MLVLNRYQRRLLSRLRMNYPARERVPLNRAVDSLAMAGLVEYEASDFRSAKKNINQYVYVWLSPISNRIHYSVCEMCNNRNTELLNTVDQLEQENVALQSERDSARSYRHKLEHLVGKFRKLKIQHVDHLVLLSMRDTRIKELEQSNNLLTEECNSLRDTLNVKENNMAKFNLDIKNVTLGGNVVVGDAIINLEVPDDLFTACVNNLTKLTEIMFSPPKSTCTCHANDEDKRPPESKGRTFTTLEDKVNQYLVDNSFAPMDVE